MIHTKPLTPFGRRIVAGMATAAIASASDLAKRIRKSPSTVHRWLYEDVEPPDALTIIRLGDLLHVSMRWLITGEGTPIPRMAVDLDEADLIMLRRRLPQSVRPRLNACARELISES